MWFEGVIEDLDPSIAAPRRGETSRMLGLSELSVKSRAVFRTMR
jgi:hypothetical protein